jgi:hypothetical protein
MNLKSHTLFEENIFRKCVGDRHTTRNTLDIKPGQIILVRRGLHDIEAALIVSLASQVTKQNNCILIP